MDPLNSYQHYVSSLPHMSTEFVPIVVPEFDRRDEPMTLCNWLVDCGDRIEEGEEILEISLPGIVCDITSPVSGRLEAAVRVVSEPLKPGDICGWIRHDIDSASEEMRESEHDAARSKS